MRWQTGGMSMPWRRTTWPKQRARLVPSGCQKKDQEKKEGERMGDGRVRNFLGGTLQEGVDADGGTIAGYAVVAELLIHGVGIHG